MGRGGKKLDVLQRLKGRMGEWVSGDELSQGLGITRAAVSKHIASIKQQGYLVESAPGKGYLLTETPDLLSEEEIQDGLATQRMGQAGVIHFAETDSTNVRAREAAMDGAPEGTLLVAESQTAGKGRKGRSWLAGPGEGLLFSLILRPRIEPSRAALITLMTAVSVAEAIIEETGIEARIKWPNDILVHGKKLSGILTEMSMELDAVDHVITGVGLNVNTPPDAFDESIVSIATSIFAETGKPHSRVKLLKAILTKFESCYDTLVDEGAGTILCRWKELSDIIGRRVRVDLVRGEVSGVVDDIAPDGVLLLKDDAGEFHRILSGDVIYQES